MLVLAEHVLVEHLFPLFVWKLPKGRIFTLLFSTVLLALGTVPDMPSKKHSLNDEVWGLEQESCK